MAKKLHDFERELEASAAGQSKIRELQTEAAGLKRALDHVFDRRKVVEVEMPSDNNVLKFGVIGDTHFGSICEQLGFLDAYYRTCEASGVSQVFHTGDVLDGWKVYKGQEFEQHARGWAEQKAWFIEHAPRITGITTSFITGNHDGSLKKLVGLDVGPELSHVRPDWRFLGEDICKVDLKTKSGRRWRLMLVHPSGGTAYAVSYRLQKLIESLEGGDKPNLVCVGHFHKAEQLPNYRNVCGLQSGTFQSQTPFMATKGLSANMGGWIVEVQVGSEKTQSNRIRAEFIAYY